MQKDGHLSKRLFRCRIYLRVVHDSVEPAWKARRPMAGNVGVDTGGVLG